jgi:hypothetical protein
LHARFATVHGPIHFWEKKTQQHHDMLLHNVIIDDEKGLSLEFSYDNIGSRVKPQRNLGRIQALLETYHQI